MDFENIAMLLLIVIMLVSMWKLFEKAGRKGWEAIIPIYNTYVLLKIIKKPWYWLLLMLIPYVGIIWSIWSMNLLSKSFGKGILTTLGLIFIPFITLPILAFGESKYTPLDGKAVESFEDDYEDIKEKAVDIKEDTQEALESAKEDISEAASDLKDSAKKVADKASDLAKDAKESAEKIADKASEKVADAAKAVKETASDAAEKAKDAASDVIDTK